MDRTTNEPEQLDFEEALGRTIQVLRTDQGVDRKDLAERVGISYSYLAAIENGKKSPSSQVLLGIAEALGLRSHELLASAESRIDRTQRLRSGLSISAPSQRVPWLASQAVSKPMASMASAPLEERTTPVQRSIPRSRAGFVMELERIAEDLSESDLELLLEMARRLSEVNR